ncbi:peptidylprolyl isomerase [Paenibacillus harenae]|uniref:peptidylprolyl isomerase n=1 Tax=Paenibacillus harenae TaxID=306543 RepID=A0ABT9U8G7_PAEHA|nr:peptidylprolyl isomerase [Paenibacillus harenae]MDQ0115941.1 foldase protein PrsA [Paenibacillus harenae]
MKKYEVLKAVVILQAVCMVVLAVVVVVKVWPWQQPLIGDGAQGNEESEGVGEKDGNHSPDKGQIVARVGGEPITMAELQAELHKQYGENVLRDMMLRKAIELEAAKSNLSVSPQEQTRELEAMAEGYESEAEFYSVMQEQLGLSKERLLLDVRYRLLFEKIVVRSIDIDDNEVEQYIAEHQDEFEPREQLHLQWILTETEQQADDVLEKLIEGEDFAMLARTYSQDSFTAEYGGDLGLIDADDPFYDSEMMDTASRLQIAEMAGPIAVDGGFAIIRLVERRMTTSMTEDRLKDAVRKQLALEQAGPMNEQEDMLLAKYNAVKNE